MYKNKNEKADEIFIKRRTQLGLIKPTLIMKNLKVKFGLIVDQR